MANDLNTSLPIGTKALILSKLYFGVLSKSLESLDIDRYFSTLYFLNQHQGCTQQCICNHLSIDKTAMVKVMDALIESGYIEKKVNPRDRREYFVFLTKKGKRQTEKIVTAFTWIDLEIFKSISFEEQENFNKVLLKIETNLKRLPAKDLYFNYKKSSKINGKKKAMSAASITQ